MTKSLTQAAAQETLVSFSVRIISFLCTQYTLRSMDPSTLGKASIQLELLLSTSLFISREGFRLALTRKITTENWNVAFLTLPACTVIAFLAWILHSYNHRSSDHDLQLAGALFCLATWVEGVAEVYVLHSLRQMNMARKGSIEGAAAVVKSISTVVALQYLKEEYAVTAFGVAQLAYAVTFLVLFRQSTAPLPPPDHQKGLDPATCRLVAAFSLQGIFKHALTEGDRMILTALADSYNQGVYAMASAYGSLAARLLLQPLEENARLLWSRLVDKDEALLRESYTTLVKLVLYFGTIFAAFAVNYTSIFIYLLAGRRWSNNPEASEVLSAYCVYTAFMGANGVTEAFVYALSGSVEEIAKLTAAHTMIGVGFGLLAMVLVSYYGTVGLVGANCVAMLLRTLYSLSFALRYFAKSSDKSNKLFEIILPRPTARLAFALSYLVTRLSVRQLDGVEPGTRMWWMAALKHIGVGLMCFIATGIVTMVVERDFYRSLRCLLRAKRD